jgi:hypothetical protein
VGSAVRERGSFSSYFQQCGYCKKQLLLGLTWYSSERVIFWVSRLAEVWNGTTGLKGCKTTTWVAAQKQWHKVAWKYRMGNHTHARTHTHTHTRLVVSQCAHIWWCSIPGRTTYHSHLSFSCHLQDPHGLAVGWVAGGSLHLSHGAACPCQPGSPTQSSSHCSGDRHHIMSHHGAGLTAIT